MFLSGFSGNGDALARQNTLGILSHCVLVVNVFLKENKNYTKNKLAGFEMRKQFLDEKSHRRVLFVRNYDFFALKSV